MKYILLTIALLGVAAIGASGLTGLMIDPIGLSADNGMTRPSNFHQPLFSAPPGINRASDSVLIDVSGSALYAQADEENEDGQEEKKEEEAPPVPSVDRVWDIVLSA